MNNSSKRLISRIVAFVMLVSCMFTNIISTNAKISDISSDIVVSGPAVNTQYKWSADELELEDPLAANPTLSGEIFEYSIVSAKSKVSANEKIFADGSSFAQRLQMGGTGKLSTDAGVFTITAPSAGQLYVYAITGSNATGRAIELYSSDDILIDSDVSGPITDPTTYTYPVFVYDITSAGTYKVTATSGAVNFCGMAFVAEGGSSVEEPTEETTVEETTIEETTVEETTVEESTVEETTSSTPDTPATIIGNDEVNFSFWLDDYSTEEVKDDGTTTRVVEPGVYTSGGSKVTLVPGINGEKYTTSYANAIGIVRDGKVVNGYKAGNRPTECNAFTKIPEAGSCILFEASEVGTFTVYFASTSFLRINDYYEGAFTYTESEVAAESYSIKVEPGHTYIASTTGKTNNMAYAGVEFVKDEAITVATSYNNIDANPDSLASLEVYLTDAALGTKDATIKQDTTEVNLAKGHTYKVSTNDGGVEATINGSDTVKVDDDTPLVIDLKDIPDVTLTGEITGTPEGTVTKLQFVNALSGVTVDAVITGTTYTATMKPGNYTTVVETTNGGITKDRVAVKAGIENVNEVYVEVPAAGNGAKYILPEEVANTETVLTLNGITANNSTSVKGVAGSTIVVPVTGTQKVTVAGWYAGTWDINGQNSVTTDSSANATSPTTTSYVTDGTETSVTVNITGEGANYLYWIEVEDVVSFKSEINVPGDYDTLNDAMDAIGAMTDRPDGEDGRITINLTSDLQEQIVFDAPYITLNGNGHEINWYYGVGTFYYSIDPATGLYNETLARDKYSYTEGNGSLWGGVAIIRGDNFIAENTTFRNTYNYEVTEREVPDIYGTVTGIPARTSGTDVTKYASKERSNAFYIEAKNIEAYNCKILSSQDTLGRNGSTDYGYSAYFNSCVIGGNVDYICGEFAAVFDNCELQWKTYANDPANNAKVGYIVAPKTNPYVFRNCTITTEGLEGEDAVTGLYGRTWGANSNCSFINTETNGHIKAEGWGEMTAGDMATANFKEYNNTVDGCYGFVYSTNATATGAAVVADYIDTDTQTACDTVLGGWVPVHYSFVPFEESTGTTESTTEATTQAPAGKDSWIAKEDPALAGDPVTFAGGQKIFTSDRFDLVAGDGGAVSGDVTETDENFVVTVIGKWIKDTSSDAAGREFIDCSGFGGGASAKVRVVATAKSKCDGTLIVNLKANGGKEIVFFDADTKECLHYEMVAETTDPYTVTLPVAAGQNISMGGIGTSPWFYDVTVSNEIPAGTDAWIAKEDPALAADNTPITFNGGQTIFESTRLTLKAGDGGAISGDVTETDENFVTTVVGKYIKDTSSDAAGREFIDCSGFGGNASAKVRVFATAEAGCDGNLIVTLKANGGKELVLFDAETKACVYYQMVDVTTDPYTINIPVTAGQKISIGGIGTSPWFYSVAVSNEAEEPTESTTEEVSTEATTEETTEASTEAQVGWVAKDDPALAGDPVTFAGGQSVFSNDNFDLVAGAGGAISGDVTETDENFVTTVIGKFVKDTSSDAAGREMIDCSLYGGKTADKVRVVFEATAKIDGTLTVDLKANAGKTLVLFDTNTKDCLYYVAPAETTDPYEIKVPIAAGQTISIGAVGSSPWMYGVNVTDEVLPTVEYPMGDVNHSGTITALDASLTLQYVLNNSKKIFAENADVSENGIIDSEDVAMILQKALDSSYRFPNEPAEEPTTEETTEATTVAPVEPVDPVTVYVVGDSTGCHYGENDDASYYYKRVGFGDGLSNYLRSEATVVNLALSGRSSKSFTTEANYETLKNSIKAGDILLIAFGHNDEKSDDAARYTAPSTDANPTTKDTEGSFKNSLYVNYIKLAQDAGATPIVCSPIVRRTTSDTWSASQLHQANGGDYAADAKAVAEECGVPFIDLTYITKAKYDELTPANTVNLHAWTNSKDNSVDNTHLNAYGAKEVAYLIATNAPDVLVPYVLNGIVEPTTADLVVNPNYVESTDDDITGDDLNSVLWTTTSPWRGTVFGDIGGNDKLNIVLSDGTIVKDHLADKDGDGVANFVISENADGSIRVKAGDVNGTTAVNSFGKIAGSTDGIAMYYQPVDVAQNFSISAKATVTGVANGNNQTAFGAIVADKILVDKYDAIMIDNYVAASPLKMSANVGTADATTGALIEAWAGYARIAGTLTKGASIATQDELPQPGQTIDVKITKVGNKYTVQYGGKTSEFEVEMTGTVYVGVFAARCADITYTDINFNNEVTE